MFRNSTIYYSQGPSETRKIADRLVRRLQAGDIVGLFGGLGAGKTVFVQGLLNGLGIKRRARSPSFLVSRRITSGRKIFYHLDLYRQRDEKIFNYEIYQSLRQEKAIAAVEWAQKSRFWKRVSKVKVYLYHLKGKKNSRKICIRWS